MDDLLGRHVECAALDRLVANVLAGSSRVLVLRGEAGVGKSALLGYLSGRIGGWHVARAVGVESEMELAYSGLHQLCALPLDHLGELLQVGPIQCALYGGRGLASAWRQVSGATRSDIPGTA